MGGSKATAGEVSTESGASVTREGNGDDAGSGIATIAKISDKQQRQLLELQLVQSRDSIISPPILFRAEAIE